MHKKKILIVTELYPYQGNIFLGTFVIQQLQVLKHYFDITVLTVFPAYLRLSHKQPPHRHYESGLYIVSIPYYPLWLHALSLIKIPTPVRIYLNKLITRRRLLRTAKHLHAIKQFELVHGHETYIGDEAGPIGHLLGIPSIFTLHSFYYYHKKIFGKFVARLALKNLQLCDRYISVSSIAAESYIKEGLSRSKFTIIPNGVNEPHKKMPNQQIVDFAQNRKVLLSVGYISEDKRFDISIRVISQLSSKEAILVIVGIGPNRQKLEELAKSLNCSDRILWLGSVPPNSMSEVYQSANILLHPSVIDSFSMVCLEAMSYGKVVICTNLIGICEFTHDGENIIFIPPNDTKALIKAVYKVLHNTNECLRIGNNARVFAKTMTWQHQVDMILKVYKTVIKE